MWKWLGSKTNSNNKNCLVASGVDGSKLMIKKAKKIDKKTNIFMET